MTAFEINAEVYRNLSRLAGDENRMKKVLRYVISLAEKKEAEETPVMSKEDIKESLAGSVAELRLANEGKIKLQSWNEALNELKNEL